MNIPELRDSSKGRIVLLAFDEETGKKLSEVSISKESLFRNKEQVILIGGRRMCEEVNFVLFKEASSPLIS